MIPTLSAPEQAHRSGIIGNDLGGIKGAVAGANLALGQPMPIYDFDHS